MYVEAICPLCFATHIVPEDMRGEEYRCEHCEELFIINRKSKKTSKKPPRPPQVRPADEPDGEVTAVEPVEVLPEAKLVPEAPKKKPRADEDEVLEIPDDALQSGQPVVKTTPASKRRRDEDDDDDRPRRRRRDEDDEDDRPRRRPAPRGGVPVGLVVGLSAGAVLLLGLIAVAAWWALAESQPGKPPPQALAQPPANNAAQNPMKMGPPIVDPPPPGKGPPIIDPPPKVDPPQNPPPKAPPKVEPPLVWNVKADPPAAPVKLPADFKKEIPAPGGQVAEVVFPTGPSPFVAIGSNRAAGDERQVWNLQTSQMTGKVVGKIMACSHPVLSPDGAHMAFQPSEAAKRGTVDVWALGPGKMVTINLDFTTAPDLLDFAGPGKLLVGRRSGNKLAFRLYDATTGQQEGQFETIMPPSVPHRDSLAISPGGANLAVIDHDNLRVYDVKTGAEVGRCPLPKPAGAVPLTCHGLSFSPDGSELAAVFFANATQPHVICWDVAKGEVLRETSFPQARPQAAVLNAYKGHVIDWLGGRRGWLLYGYTMVDRSKDGSATFLAQPPQGAIPAPRHLVGSGHVAALAPGARPTEMVLTVSNFDPDKPN